MTSCLSKVHNFTGGRIPYSLYLRKNVNEVLYNNNIASLLSRMNKQKRNTIIYWGATLWLALAMISTAAVQLFKEQSTVEVMNDMGYPLYFLTILGVGKLLGVIAILIPRYPLLKEWAYAGFIYIVAGAAYTYIAMGNFDDLYHLAVILILVVVSWYFRPQSRRMAAGHEQLHTAA